MVAIFMEASFVEQVLLVLWAGRLGVPAPQLHSAATSLRQGSLDQATHGRYRCTKSCSSQAGREPYVRGESCGRAEYREDYVPFQSLVMYWAIAAVGTAMHETAIRCVASTCR